MWAFLTICGLAAIIFEYLEKREKHQQFTKGERQELEGLRTQLHQIEKRLENLETIVVDRNRKSEYDELSRL